eukprot:UN26118
MSTKDWYYVFQTSMLQVVNVYIFANLDMMYWRPLKLDLDTVIHLYSWFFLLQFFKDIFSLKLLHQIMHENATAYQYLHKEHHSVNMNAQALMAFHIDAIDLVLENM